MDISKDLGILLGVFLILIFLSNFYPRFPQFPGDLYIEKLGFGIKIPFVSAIAISIIFTILLNSHLFNN